MLFVKETSCSSFQSQANKAIAPIWLITNPTVIPALVPALEGTVDGLDESTSVDEAASEVEVLSTVALFFADGVASEVEVLSAEVTSSVEEVASEVEVTSSSEEVGLTVTVL